MNPNTIALAVAIADDAARSEIECYCGIHQIDERPDGPGCRTWYDTRELDDLVQPEDIARSLAYLQLRGLLVRQPDADHIVTFRRAA